MYASMLSMLSPRNSTLRTKNKLKSAPGLYSVGFWKVTCRGGLWNQPLRTIIFATHPAHASLPPGITQSLLLSFSFPCPFKFTFHSFPFPSSSLCLPHIIPWKFYWQVRHSYTNTARCVCAWPTVSYIAPWGIFLYIYKAFHYHNLSIDIDIE